MSAGSVFNIIFAFLTLIVVFFIGKDMHLGAAIISSAKTVWAMMSGTVEYLANVFTGHGTMDGLAGPVGIAVIAGEAAAKGFLNLLYFTGMLSLSLGIMNLFPFPALDGGQLLMLLIEAARKKPLSLKTYQAINAAGMAIFLLLTIVVTYRDIVRVLA
jgi:regulator of sigma E protease